MSASLTMVTQPNSNWGVLSVRILSWLAVVSFCADLLIPRGITVFWSTYFLFFGPVITVSFAAIIAFIEDAEISSPEDESDAWKSIVDDFRDGAFVGLLRDTQRLLTHSDREIFEFLRSMAPAWTCETPADARRSVEVFQSYVQAYSD